MTLEMLFISVLALMGLSLLVLLGMMGYIALKSRPQTRPHQTESSVGRASLSGSGVQIKSFRGKR